MCAAEPTNSVVMDTTTLVLRTELTGRRGACAMPTERVPERHGSAATEISLLGGFRLECHGRPVVPPTSARRVLALLALHANPLDRGFVAGTLWLDVPERHAAACLRSTLWRLRQAAPDVVETRAGRIALAPGVGVDVRRLIESWRRLQSDAALCDVDHDVFTQDLLPDWYDDWVQFERERLRQLRLMALEALAERLIDAGDLPGAVRSALAAVHSEPLRESSHRLLIRAHLTQGNQMEAVRQYRLYSRLIDSEMGLMPSPLMEELVSPLVCGASSVRRRSRVA
jgi:DNA-binding SARP family transcriptional activator